MDTVFITGADSGVGLALCKEFLAHGQRVFAGRFLPHLPQLKELSDIYPDRLTCIPLDVGNTESVRKAAAQTAALCDTLDMLINCAGIARADSQEDLKCTLNVNAFGALRMTEAFLPLMKNGKKRLCYVSSEAGCLTLLHRDNGYAYCASKTVLNMTVRLMFNELKGKGYTFRLYHPGWVRTRMGGEAGNYEPEETAAAAYGQFVTDRAWEDVLVMTDLKGEAWPF